jgi:hypothetical protein
MFGSYNEVLTQSRIDHLYDVQIPAAELRTQAQARSVQPDALQPSLRSRLGRRLRWSERRQRVAVSQDATPAD